MRRKSTAALLSSLLVFSAPLFAQVPGIAVSPTRVELGQEQRSTSLTLSNNGPGSHRFQVEVMRWTQSADGEDRYTPVSDEILANPPLFELGPDSEQVVRIGLLAPAPATTESSYRIYLTEIAPNVAPREPRQRSTGVKILIRMGVPLFVAPTAAIRRELQWSAIRDGSTLKLLARNRGNVHIRRSQIHLSDPDAGDAAVLEHNGFKDILPGATWTLETPLPATAPTRLTLEALTNDSSRDHSVIRVESR